VITFDQLINGIWTDEAAENAWWKKMAETVARIEGLRIDHEIMYGTPGAEPPQGVISARCDGCPVCAPIIGRTKLKVEIDV